MRFHVECNHQDAIRPDSVPGNGDYTSRVESQTHPEKDGYGPVANRGRSIELSHPVPDIRELFRRTHLAAQLHDDNRSEWEDAQFPNDGSVLYDLKIVEVTDQVLEAEDIDPSEFGIAERDLKAIILQAAHENLPNFQPDEGEPDCQPFQENLPDFQALVDRLNKPKYYDVVVELGYKVPSNIPSYDTFRREVKSRLPFEFTDKLPDETKNKLSKKDKKKLVENLELDTKPLEHAAVRAVYSVFRNGIEPPEKVRDAYGFDDYRPTLLENADKHPLFVEGRSTKTHSKPASRSDYTPMYTEKFILRESEQEALRNWIHLLANKTLPPLTLNRTDPEYDVLQFAGLLADSALHGDGLQAVADVADWDHNRENIPEGSALPTYIKNLPRNDLQAHPKVRDFSDGPSINRQFNQVHKRTFEFAQDYGFFTDQNTFTLASDLYGIDWTGSETEATINRPSKNKNDNITSQFTFNVVGIIDKEARLTFGTRFLSKKSEYPQSVKQLFSIASDYIDVDSMYADAEMVSGELIDVFRTIAGRDFIIKAPDSKEILALKGYTPDNRVGYCPAFQWNCHPKPKTVVYPKEGSDKSPVKFTYRQLQQLPTSPDERESQPDIDDIEKLQNQPDIQTFNQLEYHRVSDVLNKVQSETSPNENVDSDNTVDSQIPLLLQDFEDPASLPGVGTWGTHKGAYFTDQSLSESPGVLIHSRYFQRWAIEESIDQIKNDFLPNIQSPDPNLRLYAVNIAVLFQNWHTIINRARSPELGLRLDVAHQQMLKTIEHVAFDNSE